MDIHRKRGERVGRKSKIAIKKRDSKRERGREREMEGEREQ